MGRLEDRVIIVTGAARVVVADIDGPGAETVAEALSAGGQEALAVQVDVAQAEAMEHMAQAALARFGRLDGLMNNAACFCAAVLWCHT